MKLISFVVPVYNEAGNVRALYEALNTALQPISDRYEFEFVFTDNCSVDHTYELLKDIANQDPRVRVYRFTRNFGFQRSILTGYRLARGDAAVQIDCDLQDPPELILEFVKLWELEFKVVYGVRRSRPESLFLRASRYLFYRIIGKLSGNMLPPDAGDFRLVDRCVLDLLREYNDENPYLRGFIAALGYRQVGVDYDRTARVHGDSSFRFRDLVSLAFDGIVNHSTWPLRLASMFGLVSAGIAFVAVIIYFALWIFNEQSWPAGFATVAILILVSFAVNAIFLGIIGEYLARIYNQSKPQPLTIIQSFVDENGPAAKEYKHVTRIVSGIVFPAEPNSEKESSTITNEKSAENRI